MALRNFSTMNKKNKRKNHTTFNPFDFPEIKELFSDLWCSIFDESGRGAILIATAHVDNHLTKLIEAMLPSDISKNHKERLFKYPGHLSSFASKIELAYVFRLISKNLYDSLNILRKIRNDAAHSHSKFELHELNEQLKMVYELGPGFANFIKEVSSKAMIDDKITAIKKELDLTGWTEDEKKKFVIEMFSEDDKKEALKKQIPFWELIYGLSFLCGLLAHDKQNITRLTNNINTLAELLKED